MTTKLGQGENAETSYYTRFDENGQKIAAQIEILLNGLSVGDAIKLLGKVRLSISDKAKIALS